MIREVLATVQDVVRTGDVIGHAWALWRVLVGMVRPGDRCDYVP